jgi:hypothetical protein
MSAAVALLSAAATVCNMEWGIPSKLSYIFTACSSSIRSFRCGWFLYTDSCQPPSPQGHHTAAHLQSANSVTNTHCCEYWRRSASLVAGVPTWTLTSVRYSLPVWARTFASGLDPSGHLNALRPPHPAHGQLQYVWGMCCIGQRPLTGTQQCAVHCGCAPYLQAGAPPGHGDDLFPRAGRARGDNRNMLRNVVWMQRKQLDQLLGWSLMVGNDMPSLHVW